MLPFRSTEISGLNPVYFILRERKATFFPGRVCRVLRERQIFSSWTLIMGIKKKVPISFQAQWSVP